MSQIKTVTSKQFTVNLRDAALGALLSTIVAVLLIIQEALSQAGTPIDWENILRVALSTFIAYMLKNFLQPSQTIIAIQPPTDAENKTEEGKAPAMEALKSANTTKKDT